MGDAVRSMLFWTLFVVDLEQQAGANVFGTKINHPGRSVISQVGHDRH